MILTQEQKDVLNHIVEDAQVWADHAENKFNAEEAKAAMLAKVAKYKPAYEKELAKGNYLNRKQREDEQVILEQEKYDNAPWDVKRQREYPKLLECVHAILDGELDALQAKRKIVKERHPKGGN
tara:strand:+ start:1487 stop:1858 length:372 start_codon:yes stop_codon:yes gene_type:complete